MNLHEQFLHEARVTAIVDHPNVCPVYEVGVTTNQPYIALHHVVGGNLDQLLDCVGSPLSSLQAVIITRQIARGLAAAHDRGVAHLDLKPQNVLCDRIHGRVLITDFGLARIGNENSRTTPGKVFGTPAYMAPEQARGQVDVIGPASDVYSLGVTLYRLLTGTVPFRGTIYEVMLQHCEEPPRAPAELWPGIDTRLNTLCLTALAKDPRARFRSGRDFERVLTEYLRGCAPRSI
jgi:serine/threonine protein kinase